MNPSGALPHFPYSTFGINILGSFLIGCLFSTNLSFVTPDIRASLQIGLLGGFTTFSSFSLETLLLWQNGRHLSALIYGSASPVLGVLAAFLGAALFSA